jgi:chaperonin GroES
METVGMGFRPLHDRVVVRRLEGEEKSKGGIIIPDTAKEKPQQGEIVAVGKWSGTEVKIDGDDLLIMKESDILGILDDAGALKQAA